MPSVEIEGVAQLAATLNRIGREAPAALGAALYQEAESIMRDSRPLVPVDTGVLRASGVVGLPDLTPTGASVEFGYGGAANQYATIQHERMDYRHASGEAKFLERPTLEAASGMGARLAARIQRIFHR